MIGIGIACQRTTSTSLTKTIQHESNQMKVGIIGSGFVGSTAAYGLCSMQSRRVIATGIRSLAMFDSQFQNLNDELSVGQWVSQHPETAETAPPFCNLARRNLGSDG